MKRLREWFQNSQARIAAKFQTVFLVFFRLITASGNYRRKHPKGFDKFVAAIALLAALALWRHIEPIFAVEIGHTWLILLHEILRGACAVFLFFLVWLFFTAFLPLLSYTPDALAMRALGLERCANEPGAMDKLLREMAREHPKEESIRIICISGIFLFREDQNYKLPPLWDWAQAKKLDVVLPLTGVNNATICSRWNGYDQGFQETKYPTVAALEREIIDSRAFLETKGNTVTSHDLLCMWQVVLFKDYCLVQNYFPNASGRSINQAPVFLFERREGSKNSYYAAFAEMFKLAKDVSSKNAGSSTAAPLPPPDEATPPPMPTPPPAMLQ